MTISARNGIAVAGIASFNGKAKASIASIDGQTLAAPGAVVLDVASAVHAMNGVASPQSWSHAGGSSLTNGCGIVRIGSASLSTPTITGVTWGGVAMAQWAVTTNTNYASTVQGRGEIWGLVNPPAGTQTIVVTWSTSNNQFGGAASQSYTGVHQTTPHGTAVTQSTFASAPSLTVTSATGEVVIDCLGTDSQAITLVAGQTSRFSGNGSNYYGAGQDAAGSASVAMGWNTSGGSVQLCQVALALKAA